MLLIDLHMPVRDGVAAIGAIRTAWPRAQVLVLTTYDGDEDTYRALQAGAHAYLLKDTPRAELLDVIRAVAGGQRHLTTAGGRTPGLPASHRARDRRAAPDRPRPHQ